MIRPAPTVTAQRRRSAEFAPAADIGEGALVADQKGATVSEHGAKSKLSGARYRVSKEAYGGLVYSPELMEDRNDVPDRRELDEKVGELERLADSLGGVPDEELVGTLNEAVELLGEINERIEARLDAAGAESQEIGGLLEGADFGPFDEALEEAERRERTPGEPGG